MVPSVHPGYFGDVADFGRGYYDLTAYCQAFYKTATALDFFSSCCLILLKHFPEISKNAGAPGIINRAHSPIAPIMATIVIPSVIISKRMEFSGILDVCLMRLQIIVIAMAIITQYTIIFGIRNPSECLRS